MLALRLKPIFEARAKEQQIRKPDSVRLISDEQTPISTDVAVAEAANLGKDTIRKIERVEASAGTLVFVAGEPQNCKIFFATLFITKNHYRKFVEVR